MSECRGYWQFPSGLTRSWKRAGANHLEQRAPLAGQRLREFRTDRKWTASVRAPLVAKHMFAVSGEPAGRATSSRQIEYTANAGGLTVCATTPPEGFSVTLPAGWGLHLFPQIRSNRERPGLPIAVRLPSGLFPSGQRRRAPVVPGPGTHCDAQPSATIGANGRERLCKIAVVRP